MSEEWNQDTKNSNWTDANTVRRLTETEVNSSTYQKQVRDRGVPQSYPDERLELRWIRPGQTSLIPCNVEGEKIEKGEVLDLFRCYTHRDTHTHARAHTYTHFRFWEFVRELFLDLGNALRVPRLLCFQCNQLLFNKLQSSTHVRWTRILKNELDWRNNKRNEQFHQQTGN